jgi:antirestriction protein
VWRWHNEIRPCLAVEQANLAVSWRRLPGTPLAKPPGMTSPRIYVASLADYNAGNLHGRWIDADQDEDTIHAEIAEMLRESKHPNVMVACPECEGAGQILDGGEGPGSSVCTVCNGTGKVPSAEEYAIHDHEGFEGIEIGEFADLEKVSMHARMLSEHDGAWAAYVGVVGEHYATEEGFQDAYRGEWKSPEDYAEETYSDIYGREVTEGPLWNYIDWERIARDMGFEGIHFVPGGVGVYVIDGNA